MIYIIGSSIGNIKDTSYRAVESLIKCDIILAEDTRTFSCYYRLIQKLFNLKPKKKQSIKSYYQQKELELLSQIKKYHVNNCDIGLITESGMPLISDPGQLLVKYLIKNGIKYEVIPGPTAITTAAVLSGFEFNWIIFLGYLPKKQNQIIRVFKHLLTSVSKYNKLLIIFYESPYRINKSINIIKNIIPNADIAICREMTKKFEQTIRSKIIDLPENLKLKGEITIVIKIYRNF